MNPQIQKIGLTGFLTLLVSTILVGVLAFLNVGLAAKLTLAFFVVGLLVSAVAYFQIRLEQKEEEELLEYEELTKKSTQSSLFDADESDVLTVKQSRRQFEKYFVPGFTIFLTLAEIAATAWLWKVFSGELQADPPRASVFTALFSVTGVGVFLVGNYIANFAKFQKSRLLKPVANHILFGAYLMGATAISYAGYEMEFPKIDLYLNKILIILLGLLAAENLVTLILEIYRPKSASGEQRVIYQSRFIELFSRPESVFTQAAQALDYQFGFKVSQTWMYKLLKRIIGWVIVAQLALLLISTSFVIIEPTEKALIVRLGKPIAKNEGILNPGLHFKWPWPIETINRYQTEQVQNFYVGYRPIQDVDQENPAVLWTTSHTTEMGEKPAEMLVADKNADLEFNQSLNQKEVPPVNLMVVSIPIQYKIKDLKEWVYEHENAATLLESIAYQETARYMLSTDFFDVMSVGLGQASEILKGRIQEKADNLKMGVSIIFVGLQDIHPSIKAAKKFQDVYGARISKETKKFEAEGYSLKEIPTARAASAQAINMAELFKSKAVSNAEGTSTEFLNQLQAYEASNMVYTNRTYLQALSSVAANARIYLIGVGSDSEVFELNLEDKLRPDLEDVVIDEVDEQVME